MPQEDDFKISGPAHLSSINWRSSDDQRIVMASLVKAAYLLEKDRQKKRVGPEALAPAWWQHFKFERTKILKDTHDSSIFGCIYELKPPFHQDPSAPRFVVAFRGTMPNLIDGFQDGSLDLAVIFGGINKTTRVEIAMDSICQLICDNCDNTGNIWIGGHSLGASIASVACKYMAKMDIHLNTFLFNPPFPSISLDLFPNLDNKLKERVHKCKTTIKVALVLFKKDYRTKTREEFSKLAFWIPNLFVNPEDPISTSYISYFERRQKMKGGIKGCIEEVETRTSFRGMCSDVFDTGSEMPHLLPSARLAVNQKKLNGLLESHELQQWWQQDIRLEFSDCRYQHDKG